MSNLVLYHSNCIDGLMAAYLMHCHFKEHKEQCDFLAVNYNEPIQDVTGKNVYIVDFSYKPEILLEASKVANKIVMMDHHLTAAQSWGGYINDRVFKTESKCPIDICIIENQSGAGIVFDYVYENTKHISNSFAYNTRLRKIVTL